MSGEWIKMRACLTTDPKVIKIGRFLENTEGFSCWLTAGDSDNAYICDVALRHLVTGALHNAWCNANEHCCNGVVTGATLSWIDNVSGVPNLGQAMEHVGWLEQTEEGLIFPKFNNHNTSGAERQKRYREKKRNNSNVTRDVTPHNALRPREEKRREEKKEEDTPIVPRGTYASCFELWWIQYPKSHRVGKQVAYRAYQKAGKRLLERGMTRDQASEFLRVKVIEFSASPKGNSEFVPHPATWLNQGRYDDNPESWNRKDSVNGTHKQDPRGTLGAAERRIQQIIADDPGQDSVDTIHSGDGRSLLPPRD